MTTIVYRDETGTGLGEYARVLLKGLKDINYKFDAIPIQDNSKFQRLKTYFKNNIHCTEPFSLVLFADLVTAQDLLFLQDSPIYTPAYRISLSRSLKSAKHIVVSSQTLADKLIKWYHPFADKISIAHQGIDTDTFHLSEDDIKDYNSLGHSGIIRVLMVGQMSRHKNFDSVLRQLINKPEFEVTLVSTHINGIIDTGYQNELKAMIRNAKNVTTLHNLSYKSLKRLYAMADIYLHPSTDGGFEMPVYEALSMGTPVIVRPLELHKELLGNTVNYSNFNGDLPDEIKAVVNFKKNLNLSRFIEQNYSAKAMATNMVKVYSEVFG